MLLINSQRYRGKSLTPVIGVRPLIWALFTDIFAEMIQNYCFSNVGLSCHLGNKNSYQFEFSSPDF